MKTVVQLGRWAATCKVARTASEQARGLQGHPPLGPHEGMLFPFETPRSATFHMGTVDFPIDIVFVEPRGRVGRIIHAAMPGVKDHWSHPECSYVVELAGGRCFQAGVGVGDQVRVGGGSYNLLRTITEAASPPLGDGYYSKEPDTTMGDERGGDPSEWFDHARFPNIDPAEPDNPMPNYETTLGYDMTKTEYHEGEGANVRAAQRISSPPDFVASLIEGLVRQGGLRWRSDMLTVGQTESTVVAKQDIERWVDALGLQGSAADQVVQAALTSEGLQALADGLVISGAAQQARVLEDPAALVLFRGVKE